MTRDELAGAMIRHGYFRDTGDQIPEAGQRWIDLFVEAYPGVDDGAALEAVAALRAEAAIVPALALERLRSRAVVFFLDAVSQYVDDQPELRGLPLQHDLPAIALEFGLHESDALWAVRMALTGRESGPPLELLFPLLGHDRIMIRIGAVSSRLLHGRGLEPIATGPDGKPFAPIAPDRQLAEGAGGLEPSS